jgi:8-hydroxy-5-deazaflavin:NADPH oxidoreductase
MTEPQPTIAIIGGTGKEGTGLALRWGCAGYKIVIGSRQIDKAKETAERINNELGIHVASGVENLEAAKMGEIVVLTVIQTAHEQVVDNLKEVLSGKILVDATSRVDYRDPRPPEPPSAGQRSQELLGASVRVVTAFQNVPANLLYKAINQPMDADVMVCSDDIHAAEEVVKLAQAAGMHGYYAGELNNSIIVEGLTSILISLNKYYKVKNASIRISGITAER